jgi:hypothetical protein
MIKKIPGVISGKIKKASTQTLAARTELKYHPQPHPTANDFERIISELNKSIKELNLHFKKRKELVDNYYGSLEKWTM